ncbi:signal peptide peptidase SppA, 67K type [Pseudopedobacter saltans DSM 12145]|uniref:Signal peptide peptidase SppA, 67K type n=1 Tax=Pseudopedobacter saltans (strain ATCC 51119 / DSM 12145 / JCM 21818 / CCUG 39354 / LMG 10337 / NBRC 100064 / NCIMB 13643) TaxID=762903 RepID=F0SB21_PSESL|nr:signal peptide peptidase SppA [Pseudopedobacter saltans]ADY52656.1 signal peptide peptidase SppA, 67K type [Pseudopedobacter saltans DSM 12145]
MKQFFKFVFASMLGIFLSIVLFIIFISIITAGLINSSNSKVEIKDNSILHINLNYPILERANPNPLEDLEIGPIKKEKTLGLNDILKSIRYAKEDDQIKGIYLDASMVQAGMATVEEIRDELLNFKKSGKFVIAYSEVYTQKSYYLASAASKVYLNPVGYLELKGLSSNTMFFKGALNKLEIEPQVIKVGTFKSAVEPFILDKMSDANKLQMSSILNSIFEDFTGKIAIERKLAKDSVVSIANLLKVRTAEDALKYKLVDALKYKDEVLDELKSKTGIDKKKNLNTVSLSDYANNVKPENTSSNRIAVIYANGEINSGEGDQNTIGSEGISRAIRKARLDDKVKAIVLRVNSPGGSSLASDVIWRETVLAKKEKPFIVSMGDYAASGGYYISCAADSIFAEPNTITGSIGVFAILPNLKPFLNNKLGITFDGVKTGEFADFGQVTRPLTSAEKELLQQEVNKIYFDFTKRVAEGRKISQSYVDSIGQGRVWTGKQAIDLGLVDKIGHIEDAIKSAAKKAKIEDYRIMSYPEKKEGLLSILDKSGDKVKAYFLEKELGESYKYYKKLNETLHLKGVQALMPYSLNFE